MSTINNDTFKFMADLYDNNNKEWFNLNRKRYEVHVREAMKNMANSIAGPVSTVVKEFSGKPKISRINNDIRFSPNKPLYKEHVWISFGEKDHIAGLFAAIGKNGWATGCGIGAPKREMLDNWRKNLVTHIDTWRKYAKAIDLENNIDIYTENLYKKPLFPDIPDDVNDMVQARGTWIVDKPKLKFKNSPEEDYFNGICRMLPIYLFMASTPADLLKRIAELGDNIAAPNEHVEKYWNVLK
ncbi:MAG: DUF2461 family protein [Candidatus Electryonea clarkiae]|nr:DUF2461 family protein [Candidatus Electryonea clarkiae]MDP8287065.1 DUF2461 family protein [Candidatus Electryonea clarkiae]